MNANAAVTFLHISTKGPEAELSELGFEQVGQRRKSSWWIRGQFFAEVNRDDTGRLIEVNYGKDLDGRGRPDYERIADQENLEIQASKCIRIAAANLEYSLGIIVWRESEMGEVEFPSYGCVTSIGTRWAGVGILDIRFTDESDRHLPNLIKFIGAYFDDAMIGNLRTESGVNTVLTELQRAVEKSDVFDKGQMSASVTLFHGGDMGDQIQSLVDAGPEPF